MSATEVNKKKVEGYALTSLLGVLYVMLNVTLGFVLSMEGAFDTEVTDAYPIYIMAFDTFQYGLSVVALFYLVFYESKLLKETKKEPCRLRAINFIRRKSRAVINRGNMLLRRVGKHQPDTENDDHDHDTSSSSHGATVNHTTSGVALLLRIGALGFGTCAILYDVMNILKYYTSVPVDQQSTFFYSIVSLRVLSIILQTYFIYKLHQIVFNGHKFLVRICLIHLIANNIYVWFGATIEEIRNHFMHDTHEKSPTDGGHHGNDSYGLSYGLSYGFNNWTHYDHHDTNASDHHGHHEDHHDDHHDGHEENKFAFIDYLFPCIVEYSLIAVGILHHIYHNVGHVHGTESAHTIAHPVKSVAGVDCSKSTTGLFGGLIVLVASVAAILCHMTGQIPTDASVEAAICIAVLPNIILLIVDVILFIQLRKLPFADEDQEELDVNLLITALIGVAALHIFHMHMAFDFMLHGGLIVDIAVVSVLRSAIELIETVFQTFFIVQASRRRCHTARQLATKPGRSFVMLALIVNFSMWLLGVFFIIYNETFFTTGIIRNPDQITTIRVLLFTRICLPLNMFFRFQSTVCFYEIWSRVYQLE